MIGTSFGAFAARVFAAKGGAVAFLLVLVFVYTVGTQAIAQTMTAPDITSEGPFLVDEGETAVATLTADDSDTATTDLIWTNTGGADSGKFSLTSEGILTFIAAKDYEAPDDAAGYYEVTVQVSDGTSTDSADLVVTLENVADSDTLNGMPAWQWERADGREGWEAIDGATAASCTPTEADSDRYVRATATYADGLGAGKTAQVMAPQVVIAYRLSALTVPGLTGVAQDDRAFYPAFDSDTLHHATRCTASVTLTLTPRTPIRACRSTACRGRRGKLSP